MFDPQRGGIISSAALHMRRLSGNLISISILMDHRELQRANLSQASGSAFRQTGRMTPEDNARSGFQTARTKASLGSMKAAVPCLVLGSTFISATVLVILSVLVF